MSIIIPGTKLASSAAYSIDQSIRFPRASNTSGGYLEKTYSGAGDRTAYTFSTWFKLGDCNGMATGSNMYYQFFGCETATNDAGRTMILINNDSSASGEMQLRIQGHNTFYLMTNRKVRDPSAWYHLVVVWDSDNTVSTERVRMYLNGVRETSFAQENYPSSGAEGGINLAAKHLIGTGWNIGGSAVNYLFDGYMAETVFLDGTATDASSFGEFNDSGIWVPKDVSELTFGTNGFWINGSDSADLGDDESGRGNDYTASGLLAAHDQVFDSPTNNFCTVNPLFSITYDSNQTRPAQITPTNQSIRYSSGANGFTIGTQVIPPSGKWYYELYTGPSYPALQGLTFGWTIFNEIIAGNKVYTYSYGIGQRHTTSAYSVWYYPTTTTNTGLTPFGQGVTIGVAIDFSANTITLTKDGSAYGSIDYDTVSQPFSNYTEYTPYCMQSNDQDATCTFNFGADSTFNGQVSAGGNSDANGFGNFKYSVPADHLCLCTRNLGS